MNKYFFFLNIHWNSVQYLQEFNVHLMHNTLLFMYVQYDELHDNVKIHWILMRSFVCIFVFCRVLSVWTMHELISMLLFCRCRAFPVYFQYNWRVLLDERFYVCCCVSVFSILLGRISIHIIVESNVSRSRSRTSKTKPIEKCANIKDINIQSRMSKFHFLFIEGS